MSTETTRKVLVGTDGSASSERAVEWAAADAVADDAELEIVATWMVPPVPFPEPTMVQVQTELDEKRAKDAASDAEKIARDVGVTRVTSTVRQGRADMALEALSADADLMVVGSTGRGTISGFLLGSISHYLLHHAQSPLVLVPATGGEVPPRQIIVGVDGSPSSTLALTAAASVAARHGSELTVITSYDQWRPTSASPPSMAQDAVESWTENWLREVVVTSGLTRPVTTITTDLPASDFLLASDSDLVVVGSRGRGGFKELVLGSTSRKVAYHARRPTLVVRSPQEE